MVISGYYPTDQGFHRLRCIVHLIWCNSDWFCHNIPVLQRECDLACARYSATSVEVEHLRESLRAVEVARGAAEEEVRPARDAATDAQARAFGEF